MKRTLLVFCLSCLFITPGSLSAQTENELGLISMGLSPEVLDSLRTGKGDEPTLQEILDSLGYNIDVENDKLPTELWEVISGQYSEVMLAEIGGAPDQAVSGWYVAGSRYDTTVVFRGPNTPPDTASFYITGCDSNGLYFVPSTQPWCYYIYYTEQRLNLDNKDHAWVFCSKKRPNEFIIAWEEGIFLGDHDYNDLILLYQMPNRAPVLEVPNDTSFFFCETETICFNNISAYDLDYCGDTVSITKIQGPGTYDEDAGVCCFLPAPVDSVYEFVFVATDWFGAADTGTVVITVDINDPPQLSCPEDSSVHAGGTFISTDFSVTDPEGDSTVVTFLDINPSATDTPTIVGSHVEWITTCNEDGDYIIRLVATDSCGAKDTCEFTVNVYNQPPVLTCPDDDSVNAGDLFVSTDYSVSDPDDSTLVTVDINSIFPTPTNPPTIVDNHVEWLTTCDDLVNGPVFTITLVATDPCGAEDTCDFTVTVYNLPPQITCPDDDSVYAGDYFTSTNFSVSDPKAEPVTVALCGVDPAPVNQPIKVETHVEWQTECADAGNVFTICLEATDSCGAKDTCYFQVTVYNQPPVLTCPDDDSVNASDTLVSTDFSVTDPDGDTALVTFLDITPPATNNPTIVGNHVEWVTTSAEDGDYVIRLVATDSCGVEDTCEFNVYSQPPPDFTISAAPDTQYVTQGYAVGYKVKLTSLFGFDEPCTLLVSGLPAPPDSGVFDQATLIPTDSTTLNVYTTTDTDTGWYTLTITAQRKLGAKPANLEHSIEVVLKVEEYTDVGDYADNPNVPKTFALFQNQPNPFNPETRISYYLPKACQVKLTIYNILGQNVRTLFDGHQDTGMQALLWDGKDDDGVELSSGIYFYRLQADDFHQTKKMTLLK